MKDRAYEIARNCGYDGYQRGLACMVYKVFDRQTWSAVSADEQLAEELHEPVTKKFRRRKVYARFKGNIWSTDLAEVESLCFKNKNVKYLLYVIDVVNKYAWVKSLKDKKGKTVLAVLFLSKY